MGYENVVSSNKRRAKHGMYKTKVYAQWQGAKDRCYNSSNVRYQRYGGRGIVVCERWRDSFENFYTDMGDPPDGMSLDRMDNDKDYSPENCRWATPREQANNRGDNSYITHDGVTKSVADWARHYGLPYHWVLHRFKRGYKPPELFSKEHLPYRKSKTFDYQGRQVTMKELSALTGIKLQTLYARLYAGKLLV